jgi:hypothetical protein
VGKGRLPARRPIRHCHIASNMVQSLRRKAHRIAKDEGVTMEEARRRIAKPRAARPPGRPVEFAVARARSSGARAAFITGRNPQRDGGSPEALL